MRTMTRSKPAARLTAEGLARCCQESGWNCHQRSTGRITVALETEPPRHAELVAHDHGIHASVVLANCGRCGPASRRAATALLEAAAAETGQVSAAVHSEAGSFWLRAQAECAPTPEALDAALTRLAVVSAQVTRELAVLEDETIARDYLAIRDRFADDGKQHPD